MKKLLICFLFIWPLCGSAQSLFFDLSKTTSWVSSCSTKEDFKNANPIGLSRKYWLYDTLPEGKFRWTFRDSTLSISRFSAKLLKEIVLIKYKCSLEEEHGIVKIWMNEDTYYVYRIGITSIGEYAELTLETTKQARRRQKADLR